MLHYYAVKIIITSHLLVGLTFLFSQGKKKGTDIDDN